MRWGRLMVALLVIVLAGCASAPTGSGRALLDRDRPLRVMPLGDSITEGGNAPDGYRGALRDLLVRQDHLEVEFVGTRRLPGSDLAHEGHSGFRIDQLRAVLDEAITSQQPDVVLLHIGSNDVGQNYQLDTAPQRLQELAARICALRPQADLFVASLIPINGLQDRIAAFNAYVPSVVAGLQAYGCRAHYVDANSAVPLSELVDGVHPDQDGYARLAALWYPQVRMVYSRSSTVVPYAINDDVLLYTGNWRHDVDRPSAYWSDRHVSGNPGDTALYRYTGSVAVHGTRCPSCGMAAISVDDGSEAIVDLYDPAERDQAEIYRSPPSGSGLHTLVVRVLGTSDPASAGTSVVIDRLDFSGW